jgi:two-component system KDP operon response regulator KdpE
MTETTGIRQKVLIIDDEPQIRRLLKMALEANHFKVFEAENGRDGLLTASMQQPQLILLDLGLPDIDGLAVLERLRSWTSVPVLILTVRDQEQLKVQALDNGADDYITKPFNTAELMARVRVALRHSQKSETAPVITSGPITIDLEARMVRLNGEEIRLTATEYSLLALLMKNSGKVLTHSFICREIWGNPYADNAQVLRVHIAQLRKKIGEKPALPRLILTEPAVGYRFRAEAS